MKSPPALARPLVHSLASRSSDERQFPQGAQRPSEATSLASEDEGGKGKIGNGSGISAAFLAKGEEDWPVRLSAVGGKRERARSRRQRAPEGRPLSMASEETLGEEE